jgi:hypothetical protein
VVRLTLSVIESGVSAKFRIEQYKKAINEKQSKREKRKETIHLMGLQGHESK